MADETIETLGLGGGTEAVSVTGLERGAVRLTTVVNDGTEASVDLSVSDAEKLGTMLLEAAGRQRMPPAS
ncbi:MAG: hypothetical protein ACLQRH_15340 [Acidimicrobiales bacterium]|jgi:hypothetical protein